MTQKRILDIFARAITKHEGLFPPSARNFWRGSRSYRNNNPGNLRYIGQAGSTGKDKQNFAIFKTFEAGYNALIRDIEAKFSGNTRTGLNPKSTIQQFFQVYAPVEDSNDPWRYAMSVVRDLNEEGLKATVQMTLSQLLSLSKSELNILAVLYNIKNQQNIDTILSNAVQWLQNVFGQEKDVRVNVKSVQGEPLKYDNLLILQGSSYIPKLGKEINREQLQSIYKPLLGNEKYVWFIDADNLGNTVAIGQLNDVFVSEINWRDKAEILATMEVLLHELLHSFVYKINSSGQVVEDRVHHFALTDQRPEARFETYLNLLKPYWSSL